MKKIKNKKIEAMSDPFYGAKNQKRINVISIKYKGNASFRSITFGDVLDMWLKNNSLRLKKATLNKYQSLIDSHIRKDLGEIRVSQLSSSEINDFLAEKSKCGRIDNKGGLSASYVRSIAVVIKSAMDFAEEQELCPCVSLSIRKPPIRKNEPNVISKQEQQRLTEYLIKSDDPTSVGIMISLYMGLRIGEICALKWEDIDFGANILCVRHTVARIKDLSDKSSRTVIDTPKTSSSERKIPIPSSLVSFLRVAEKKATSQYVVSGKYDFVHPRTFEYRFHSILDKACVTQVNFHVLRHTFATRCVESGVDVKSLSEILGHSNVNITLETYVHSSLELKRKQLEKTNDLINVS